MRLSRAHFPLTVLGPGRRAGVWFQGCTIGCRGCMSGDTWSDAAGTVMAVEQVLGWLDTLVDEGADGVTISGGEPTEQPEALRELLDGIGTWRVGTDRDVLLYTGRSPGWATRQLDGLLRGVDAVVAGPYVARLAGATPLRGSENQELILPTALGRTKYADLHEFPRTAVQLGADPGGVWLIGIPLPGDLAAFDAGDAATASGGSSP